LDRVPSTVYYFVDGIPSAEFDRGGFEKMSQAAHNSTTTTFCEAVGLPYA